MSKNHPHKSNNPVEAPQDDDPGLIWVDKQFDVMTTMTCNECGNPISVYSDYKCRKCGLCHFFRLKQQQQY